VSVPYLFQEPTAPRYIYVNPTNNRVHLLVPIVGGQEISTDNTCQSRAGLKRFFRSGDHINNRGFHELIRYRDALQSDCRAMEGSSHPERVAKLERLTHINCYIRAFEAFAHESLGSGSSGQGPIEDAIRAVLRARSNLFSMHLRPEYPDAYGHVESPIFTVNRVVPSPLKNELHQAFQGVRVETRTARSMLIDAVTNALPGQNSPSVPTIQTALTTQIQRLCGMHVSFTHNALDGTLVTEDSIKQIFGMSADENLDVSDSIDGLIGLCAPNVLETIPAPESVFYSVAEPRKTEKLSIMTQFFLAHVNIHCFSNQISLENFGALLDKSPSLSQKVAALVASELGNADGDVGQALCAFINVNDSHFKLTRELNVDEIALIQEKFERTYQTVTGTNENRHMDEFMLLDKNVQNGKFFTHQGSICIDFSEILNHLPHRNYLRQTDQLYFNSLRQDGLGPFPECVVPHRNEHVSLPPQQYVGETLGCALLSTVFVTAALSAALVYAAEMTWLLSMAYAFPVGLVAGALVGLSIFNSGDDKAPVPGYNPGFAV
jgi:hypothetical protein